MFDLAWLFALSLMSGLLSAMVGLGGGLLLLGIIPLFVPVAAVIPIQGVVNLSSNLSRFLIGFKQARLDWLGAYAIGGLAGAALGFPLIGVVSERWLSLILACFILLSVWTTVLKLLGRWLKNTLAMAMVQSFLALFVGSVAALSVPLLQARGLSVATVIATSAMQMSVLNLIRVAAFALAGFAYADFTQVILVLIVGSVIGTYLGSRVQQRVPEPIGRWALKLITTALALLMVWRAA